MTAKQLAAMFSGLKIPVPEMEKMINDHVRDELEKFFQSLIGLDIPENNEIIESYLNSK